MEVKPSGTKCLFYDRDCIGCGECRCDLDPDKVCDNCMRCVLGDADYRSILIEGIELSQNEGEAE